MPTWTIPAHRKACPSNLPRLPPRVCDDHPNVLAAINTMLQISTHILHDQPALSQQPVATSPAPHDAANALLLFSAQQPQLEAEGTPQQHMAVRAEDEVPSTPCSRRKVTFDLRTTPRIYKYPLYRQAAHRDDAHHDAGAQEPRYYSGWAA